MNPNAAEMYENVLEGNYVLQTRGIHLRIVEDENNKMSCIMTKTKVPLPDSKVSVFPEGFKMCLAKEEFLSDEEMMTVMTTFHNLPETIFTRRHKDRDSYLFSVHDNDNNAIGVIRVDLTRVDTTVDGQTEIRHEVELEYVGNKNAKGGTQNLLEQPNLLHSTAEVFFKTIQVIFQTIQGSKQPLNNMQHNAVIRAYLESVGKYDPYGETNANQIFVGCQPESLHARHLSAIVEEPYFVTSKTDGFRYQLIAIPCAPIANVPIDKQPYRLRCYMIDRWAHVKSTTLRLRIPAEETAHFNGYPIEDGFIIDGELVSDTFWPFDVLTIGKKDIRVQHTMMRLDVLQMLVNVIRQFQLSTSNAGVQTLQVMMKDFRFWPKGKANAGDVISLMEHSSPVDGLVLMKDEPHPRKSQWPGLLKWKGSKSTIDLLVRDNPTLKRRDLFVGGSFATVKKDGSRCLVFKKAGMVNFQACWWVINASGIIVQQYSRDLAWSNHRTAIPYPFCPFLTYEDAPDLVNETVFEFHYDAARKRLIPIKMRSDKSFLGLDGANDLRVAVDLWESMRHPVTKEQLLSLPNVPVPVTNAKYEYAHEIHPSIDWPSLFLGRSTAVIDGTHVLPSQHQMMELRHFHNLIKGNLIKLSKTKRRVTPNDILRKMGGVLVENKRYKNQQDWSLPINNGIVTTLETVWGIQAKDFVVEHDRLHVSEKLLKKSKIKRQPDNVIVVDLCCGKGGDLRKYVKNKVSVVVGIDNEQILLTDLQDAALKRWAGIKTHQNETDACFVLADCRQPLYETLCDMNLKLEADLVCCFFALHYFFNHEKEARSFLQNVKDLLKPDGLFIGTILDGELMYEKLKQHQNHYTHTEGESAFPLFSVSSVDFDACQQPFDQLPTFGNHLDVTLTSTIVEQYQTGEKDKEFLVKKENLVNFARLIELASEYDLELQDTQTFNQHLPDAPDLRMCPELQAYSSTHRTFRFRKISKSAAASSVTAEQIKQSVQTLQAWQIEHLTVKDDIRPDVLAMDHAYVPFVHPPPPQVNSRTVVKQNEEFEDDGDEEWLPEQQQPENAKKRTRPTTTDNASAQDDEGCKRCRKDCRACKCTRILKVKCHDGCGCDPAVCKNR